MNKFSYYVALIISLLTIQHSVVKAQQFGVKGKVLDLETYQPIPGVSIKIANTNLATSTNESGEFSITLPNKGSEYILVSTFVGYDADSTKFTLQTSSWEFVPVSLINSSSTLDEVVVTRRRERVSEIALLEERKASSLMLEKIGAQELSRKGVSDAEGALTKLSGVTKSASGANVFVRGLGDRYNSSTLNGLPLPSEDPLNKNVSLDFFGTGVIQSIAVNKTFNPQLGGDVAGANIDILSKEFSGTKFIEVGASAGINTQSVKTKEFVRVNGTNWIGGLKETKSPIQDLTQYSFANGWNTSMVKNPVNSSFSLSGGTNFKVGNGNLNLFATGNLNSEYRYFNGVSRQTNTSGAIILDQEMTRSQYGVSKTGMLNLKYSFGNHYVALNSMYIGDQSQDYQENFGMNDPQQDGDLRLFRRQSVVNNNLFVNQLISRLDLGEQLKLDLAVANNAVNATEPDRRTVNLLLRDNNYLFFNNANGADNERYYSDIKENGWVGKAMATYSIKNDRNLDRKVEFGYQGNLMTRDFNVKQLFHNVLRDLAVQGDIYNIDGNFNQDRLSSGIFELRTSTGFTLDPNYYNAEKNIHSGVAMGTYQFNDKFTGVLGVRYDKVYQQIDYVLQTRNSATDQPKPIDKNYVLPSLNLKYAINDVSNLRASASMSYTLPQFIELAPFRNVFPTWKSEGNPDLVPVENRNFDLKWEMFPSGGELISVGVFYKNMKNPIARVEINNNVMTYYNVGATAEVAGAEVEIKKNIWKTTSSNGDNILSAGANVSYLYSNQSLETANAQFGNKTESALQGASPLLVNADASYLLNGHNWNLTTSVVFNYFSDRIFTIGTSNFANVVEKGIPMLDFVTNAAINKKWGLNFKARNILNPNINLERETDFNGNIVLESYKRGVDVSLGLSYRF